MQPIHLVTGATGFVGSALVLELLRDRSSRIVCVARSREGAETADRRVRKALRRAARAAEDEEFLERALSRVRVVSGDLERPSCGLVPIELDGGAEVWHVAATLRYEDDLAPQILDQNVAGTERMLELASALDASVFNYMSTAYVAGTRRGHILEQLVPHDEPVNNVYERSKIVAENLVAASGLPYRILRPSIVIGHSKTASASGSDSGFYGYVHRLLRFKRVLERRGHRRIFERTFLPGDPGAPLDMVPVDVVARNAVAIARSGSLEHIFHLTNAAAPELGTVAATLSERLDLGGPRFRAAVGPAGPHAPRLAEQMRFFLAYLAGGKTFDRRNTDAAIGPEASLWPLDADGTRRYLDRFLDELGEA